MALVCLNHLNVFLAHIVCVLNTSKHNSTRCCSAFVNTLSNPSIKRHGFRIEEVEVDINLYVGTCLPKPFNSFRKCSPGILPKCGINTNRAHSGLMCKFARSQSCRNAYRKWHPSLRLFSQILSPVT